MEITSLPERLSNVAESSATPSLQDRLDPARAGLDDQHPYGRSAETARIVWELLREGYSTAKIAKIITSSRKQVRELLKSLGLELAASVKRTETTEWDPDGFERLFRANEYMSILGAEVDGGHGGLGDDQEARARAADFLEDWFRAGTCTEPVDRPRVEAAIARMYAALSAAPPRFLWCDSPMSAQLTLTALRARPALRRAELRRLLPPALQDALGDTEQAWPLGAWMGDALRASGSWLQDALWASQADWLTAAVNDTPPGFAMRALLAVYRAEHRWGSRRARELLESAVVSTLSRSLRAWKIPYRPTPLRGHQESDWIEQFLFDRNVLGIGFDPLLSERLVVWGELARSCLWWWPYRQICIVSERPAEIHTLDGEYLHNDAGPAVRFRDGWSVWAIDGVLVDEQLVLHSQTQTLSQVRSERNAEVRRVRIQRYGWDRYLAEVGATVLDRRRNDIEATCESLLRGPDGETVLLCACPSTARIYALQVPPETRTCEAAQTWLSGGLAGRIINGA
jgi:hypothetical protein